MNPPISAADSRKALLALQEIERAQNLLYGAAQLLCSVPGFGDDWDRVCKHGDATKSLWHRINDHRSATPIATAPATTAVKGGVV